MSADSHIAQGGAALRLREGRAPVRERLIAMLLLTALLHAIIILGVSFSSGGHGAGDQAPQLDVMLVTNDVPEARNNPQAVYLAQRTQLGAGDTDARLPPGSPASRGALLSADREQQGADQLKTAQQPAVSEQERVLLSTGASPDIRYVGAVAEPIPAAALPELLGDLPGAPRSGRGDAIELLLRGAANSEHWVSPDTRASALAPYLAEWKRKVERIGTLNFPSAARRAGFSGSPVVEVEIAADGRLQHASVRRSSGYGALDQAALTILRLASPFDPFPADLASDYSRLRFAYQWEFVTDSPAPEAEAVPASEGPSPPPAAAPAVDSASASPAR